MDAFNRWVADYGGAQKLALALGKHERTVRRWLFGRGSPPATTTMEILKMAKGKLTFEEIIASSRRRLNG